jgi:hypothetical protein
MLNLVTPQTTKVEAAANILARQFTMQSKHKGNKLVRNVKLNNGQVVKDVPGLCKVRSIQMIKKWQGYEATVKKIESHLDGKKYVGVVAGKKLLARTLV